MARRPAPLPGPAPKKHLTPAELREGIARLGRRRDEVVALDVRTSGPHKLDALSAAITRALEKTFGEDTADFRRFAPAAKLTWMMPLLSLTGGSSVPAVEREQENGVRANVLRSVALLDEAIRSLKEDLDEQEQDEAVAVEPSTRMPRGKFAEKVFVVHGHDEAALQGVSRFLEKLGLEAVVLSERPNQGRTIIEKFEACVGEVGFAVVLLTPDDVGGIAAAAQHSSRARQNVVFELGYFAGKLGRDKTCLLRKGDVEIPSDLYGIIYIELDTHEGWKSKLAKELKTAGLDIDFNKVLA